MPASFDRRANPSWGDKVCLDSLGKRSPCFGEYKCSRCGRQWQSAVAWADYGQACKNCSNNVKAFNLHKRCIYICSACKHQWFWREVKAGVRCPRCDASALVYPLDAGKDQGRGYIRSHHLTRAPDNDHIDRRKAHESDLCERCQAFGRPCRTTIRQPELHIIEPSSSNMRVVDQSTWQRREREVKSYLSIVVINPPKSRSKRRPSSLPRYTAIDPTWNSKPKSSHFWKLCGCASLIIIIFLLLSWIRMRQGFFRFQG